MFKYTLSFYVLTLILLAEDECRSKKNKKMKKKTKAHVEINEKQKQKHFQKQKGNRSGEYYEDEKSTGSDGEDKNPIAITTPKIELETTTFMMTDDLLTKKKDKLEEKDKKIYKTMFPPQPPKIYTNPMIYPKVYVRFLVCGGFLLNFTDETQYDNIHDAYLTTGSIYNREKRKDRLKINMWEFYKSGGIWVYIRPEFGLKKGDELTGKMWYTFCYYEDDWMNFKYRNYTKMIRIDIVEDISMKLTPKYYF